MENDEKIKVTNAEAAKRWREANKEHFTYLRARTNARSFVRHHATDEDMEELIHIFNTENKHKKDNQKK